MHLPSFLRSANTLRVLVAVKLLVIVAVWFALDKDFTLGDRGARASEGGTDDAGKTAPPAAVEGAKPAEAEEASKSGDGNKPRKSFLADLLDLPPLKPEAVEKEELGKYLEIAERKERQIKERIGLLGRREEQLKGLEKSIDEKLRLLDEERRYFSQTIQREKELKGERTERLIALYTKMEPKKAAPIMEKLDKDLVVELFKQMPQKQVTAILEGMGADKSVTISEYYGRVRSAREYDILKEMNQSLRKEFDDCKGMPKGK